MLSPTDEVYLDEWSYSSGVLFYSVISIALVGLPFLTTSLLYLKCSKRVSPFLPYLYAVLIGNMVLLATLFFSVLVKSTENVLSGCLICKLSTFLVNSSSCFIHWTWVVMYAERFLFIYNPLRRNKLSPKFVILTVLLSSMLFQLWTFFVITERRLGDGDELESIFCGEHVEYESYAKLIVVTDSVVSFFIPFLLTVGADCSVLMWSKFTASIPIFVGHQKSSDESRKIISKIIFERTAKRRTIAIRKCLISASISLFLNFPNYALQLVDEFFQLQNSESFFAGRLFLRLDALFYILYLLQFPLSTIHVFFLTKSRTERKFTPTNNNSLQSQRHPLLPLNY